ncbi:2'-5'-oligoadenylate synthase-like protein 1 [Vombatus ursinus]|uniref:Ubiquitin-like domain-containing protein n=1 Tax=Vombatus ursinus TaxID=29139 RepID=A0A4X2KA14_VOMUR|nr:2'-5'-oligoadenylate synthase-like protein 1 [Vombatus ursinus]
MEQPQSLFDTPAESLDSFIAHELLPTKECKEEIHDAFQMIQKFLRGSCFKDEEARVLKVLKAGSVMNGTMLKYEREVHVVVFLSCYNYSTEASYHHDMLMLMKERLHHSWKNLAYISEICVDLEVPGSLFFTIQSEVTSEPIDVVILTAYDALGSSHPTCPPSPETYVDLIGANGLPGQFSPSFIKLRKHFIKSLPTKLKNLLRLVKHWYLQHLKFSCPKALLPPVYALELLTVYAWEMGTSEAENFNMASGFVSVMELLQDHKDIRIYWTKYYSLQDQVIRNSVKQQLKRKRPVILDPVDPTHNVGEGNRWDLVAQRAAQCLKKICCFDKYDCPIPAWNVKRVRSIQVTVKRQKGKNLTIWVDPFEPIQKMKNQPKLASLFYHQHYVFCQEPGSRQDILRCHRTLADYGIFSDVSIRLVERVDSKIQLCVKRKSRSRIPEWYSMGSNDLIGKLMCMIEDREGLAPGQYILMFQGQHLHMELPLGYYDIQEGDVFVLSERESYSFFPRKEFGKHVGFFF